MTASLTKATAEPAASPYDVIADRYLRHQLEQHRVPLKHRETYYEWDGRAYREVPDHTLKTALRVWMKQTGIPRSNRAVDNVFPLVRDAHWRREIDALDFPAWRVDEEGWPDPRSLIGFENGLLDIGRYLSGETALLPHTPKLLSTTCLPYEFDPDATCLLWDRFLAEIYEGDEQRISLLQEWAGYLMTPDTRYQKFMVLVGLGSGGKGTVFRVLSALVGRENCVGLSLRHLTTEFGLEGVLGKSAAFISEVENTGGRNAIEMLKAWTGNDALGVNRKHRVQVTAPMTARLTVAANDVPAMWDDTGALGRRLLVIEHPRSFEGREDPTLGERLTGERPGIAAWALRGLVRLRTRDRFTASRADISRQLALESAPVLLFTRERLVIYRDLDPGKPGLTLTDQPVRVTRAELQKAYTGWCSDNEMREQDPAWFGRSLRSFMRKLKTDERAYDLPGTPRVYNGVGLRQ